MRQPVVMRGQHMNCRQLLRNSFAALILFGAASAADIGRADPLLRIGIGLQTCEKLNSQLKTGAGLDHLPNALMFYWVQGYLSGANIHLLNEFNDYIDVSMVDEPNMTTLITDFCKANPDKKPVNLLDEFIKHRKKIEIKESEAFDPWDH